MFTTFPRFSKLSLEDRKEYEEFIKEFPPIGDLAFVSLMTLWSTLDITRVARLNGNLVISYWIPGDDSHSGLSLIGIHEIDESLCTIFDYLRSTGQEARLVNIPQFVVDHIRYPEIFNFDIKSGDEEYVISLKKHSLLSEMPFYKRSRIKRFVKNHNKLEIKSLDLSSAENKDLLLKSALDWPKKGMNNIGKFEDEALQICVNFASELGIKNICLFEDGHLIAYNLYHVFSQPQYMLIAHGRLDYSLPFIFDYMAYVFSTHWLSEGLEYANIHGDMGILRLRVLQIALRPVELLRKYTIKPEEWSLASEGTVRIASR
jgi:hypothetical protein